MLPRSRLWANLTSLFQNILNWVVCSWSFSTKTMSSFRWLRKLQTNYETSAHASKWREMALSLDKTNYSKDPAENRVPLLGWWVVGWLWMGQIIALCCFILEGSAANYTPESVFFWAGSKEQTNIYVCGIWHRFAVIQGVFFHWYPPKELKYGKPRLGESTLT